MNVFNPRALGCPGVRYHSYLGHVTMLCLSRQVQWLSSMKGSLFLLSLYGAVRKKKSLSNVVVDLQKYL